MFCSTCGTEVKETDKVCLACGQPNENYVAPEAPEAPEAEVVEEVAAEEVVVEAAPAPEKVSLVKPIVALALSVVGASMFFDLPIVAIILAIVAKVLIKPYLNVTAKPVSIFVKITKIVALVTILLSILAIVLWVVIISFMFISAVFGMAAGGEVIDIFEIFEEIFEELFDL